MNLVLNIPEFIKLQEEHKLNMTRMADTLGISRSQLWRILNKQCNPGEQFIAGFKIAFPEENLEKFFLPDVLHSGDTYNKS